MKKYPRAGGSSNNNIIHTNLPEDINNKSRPNSSASVGNNKAIDLISERFQSADAERIISPSVTSSKRPNPSSSGDSRSLLWQSFKTWFRGLCVCGRKQESCNRKLASWKSFRKDCLGSVPVAMETPDTSRINLVDSFYSEEPGIYDSGCPPPYSLHPGEMDYGFYNERLQDPSSVCSMETGGSSGLSYDRGETPWCKILYWEGNERKGNVFPVLDPAINVLGDTPHGSGLSLAAFFGGPPKDERIRRTRKKICQGLVLWREGKVVWVYNRSEAPVYLNSASLDGSFFNLNLYKCPPGYAMIIYYYEMANALMGRPDYKEHFQDKADVNSVRISFAKGWGKNYHRSEILCCPCWIEVHVVPTLKIEQLTPHR